MSRPRFTLLSRRWYAMEYWDSSENDFFVHASPILVFDALPRKTGKGVLTVAFFHLNYSEGVQNKEYELGILRRTWHYIMAERLDQAPSRPLVILKDMTWEWGVQHWSSYFDSEPREGGVQEFLNRKNPGAVETAKHYKIA
jgi:hypothetical protein